MNIGHFQSSNLSIIIRKRWFVLLVMSFLIVLNMPVIFGSEISRPLMIDLTAVAGAVARKQSVLIIPLLVAMVSVLAVRGLGSD
jgi:hypothetical protein